MGKEVGDLGNPGWGVGGHMDWLLGVTVTVMGKQRLETGKQA